MGISRKRNVLRKATPKPGRKPGPPSREQQSLHVIVPGKPEPAENKPQPSQKIRLKIFGIGGAGCNAIAQFTATSSTGQSALAGVELVAVNTDKQALESVTVAERIQIGAALTRGLGAGGDPELGARAAQQDAERLIGAVQNADVVFIATGLGGGTGTGASPVVAKIARDQGALVLVLAGMPFAFEGDRRRQQALAGLEQLKAQADAVICIQNDKLFKLAGDNASVLDAFQRGNEIVACGVQAVWQLVSRKGLINLDFGDLRAALAAKHCEGVFSYGEAQGPDRVRDAVKALLESPLLEGGDALLRADAVLVSILGGPDLTLANVQRTVEPISRLAGHAHVIMGAAIDESYRDRLAVTVIAAVNALPRKPAQLGIAKPPFARRPVSPVRGATPGANGQQKPETPKPKQATLPLEPVARGRFDKSEPTIYNGEDLDVPTYIRRGVKL
jgi:cell division protein FtsZ